MRSALVALSLAACTAPATGPLSPDALMSHVRALADPRLDGRRAGTPGEEEAARYVEAQLRAMGLVPREQLLSWPAGSRNVYAFIEGSRITDEVVVLGAHLDHLGRRDGRVYPGADDDASGVAAVLGIAQALASRRGELRRSVLVVFFGAEEEGMVGSRAFVADPPVPVARMAAMVNLDMIGRPLLDQRWLRVPVHLFGIRGGAVGLVGARDVPALRRLADDAFADGACGDGACGGGACGGGACGDGEVVAPEDLPDPIEHEVEAQAADRSDSAPFEDAGVPALFFGDAESDDYHRPTDTIERLHPELLAATAGSIGRVVLALSQAPASSFARSDAPPAKRLPLHGWYLPVGLTGAYGFGQGHGAAYGGELSAVHLWTTSLRYAGGYADVFRDAGTGSLRISVGPELGARWFGVDAGWLAELERGPSASHRDGLVGRVFATASILSVGLRVGYLFDGGAFAEVDVLLKYPFGLDVSSRP